MTLTYSNPRREAVIPDWPWGSKQRTTATFTIEIGPVSRERAVRVTIDPKTGRPTAPKKRTYASKARIVDGDDGRTYIAELSMYGFVSIMRGDMKFEEETVHPDNPRFPEVMALFEDGYEGSIDEYRAFVRRMIEGARRA
jgi:hypothetical protein